MAWHKRLETWAKLALTLLASVLFWRPGRRRPLGAPLPLPRRVLLVRPDNRVGEALLTTPLLRTLKTLLHPPPEVHVLVHSKVVRVLKGHPDADAVLGFDRRFLWLGPLAPGIRALRRAGYDTVVDCANWSAPSVTSALVARMVGPKAIVIGPSIWPVNLLQSVSVPARSDSRHEAVQRTHLLTPLTQGAVAQGLSFREPVLGKPFQEYLEGLARRGVRRAVINPGGRLGERRIPAEAFSAAARELVALGHVPIVTWGPGEEALAHAVLSGAPGAELAPATSIDELAALMRAAGLTVCNNTGPMHLSVAVGAPTLAFFLRIEMARWGHAVSPHRMVDLTPLVDGAGGVGLEQRVAEEVRSFVAERGSLTG
ncbi:heptosyltransferase [Corallococcus sp. BB11-1]|uniref:glycosyltransferase family 9 protein n=1 Tax=Corallococcus sp. BB11-1 TaxID=2996783 RepID=UPI0010E0526D|nr:glycosyltransferase family 9 protein [Corallococcus sp. BB11-1]MCY1031559.1 heptosyltransferase [Corallococcus sp. BB11-1]RYZ46652.1 MAG: lipopolysaccharide heptosyltransferase family protein [Myxococcaceae bacterium]